MLTLLAALVAAAPLAAPLEPWAPLVGEWVAEGSGTPGASSGKFSFAPDLGGRVLIRRNHAEGPAANGRPAYSHDDLLVLAPTAAGARASYWDNEGHAIEYDCTAAATQWTCVTRGATPAFKLEYTLTGKDQLKVVFFIAPSGKEADLKPYLSGAAHRAR